MSSAAQIAAAVLLEDTDMKFTSDARGVTLDFDLDQTAELRGTITWSLNLEVRAWGVQSFQPHIIALDLEILYQDYGTPGEDPEDVERMLNIKHPTPEPAAHDPEDYKAALMALPNQPSWQVEAGFDPGSPGLSSGMRPRFVTVKSRRHRVTVLF